MDLRIQPKPEVNILPADQGVVSRKQFFVKRESEKINQYFFPALFIRRWKPKVELLYPTVSNVTDIQYECDFNRDVQNCFVEDFAEEIYLRTPPPCFVVFGKAGNNVIELSQQIAREYGSVLIDVDDIVDRMTQTETETGKILDRILRLGVSLTLNFVLALVSYMAHTPEARHRGYVLCGLPTLSISQDMPVEQQFNYLFAWDNKPTVFVNVLFQDEDLVKERVDLRYEIKKTGQKSFLSRVVEQPEVAEDEDEDAHFADVMPIKEVTSYEPDVDISPSRPRVQLPRDEESRVWTELELYDNVIKPVIDVIHARVDPQCLLTVDSRVNNSYEMVKARLQLLQIWKVPEAIPFISPDQTKSDAEGESEADKGESESVSEKTDYDSDIFRVAEESPQVAFLTLFTKKTISPKYRWELSHYNYVCPVSLRAGVVVEGKSRFAVGFMKYIYFLHDRECMIKFMKNPRAYVLPIKPKPPCRFFVLGYPSSGKTTLALKLAKEFSIPLINLDDVLRKDSERKKTGYHEFCRQKAECRELIRLTVLSWQNWRKEEEKRVNLIEDWLLYMQSLLRERIRQFYSPEAGLGLSEKSETVSDVESVTEVTLRVTPDDKRSVRSKKKMFTPSTELIEAMKEGRRDFNKDEANSYFSSIWKSFSRSTSKGNSSDVECYEEDFYEEEDEDESDKASVNWCDLLPPQSLSSFFLYKLSNTAKVKRESFKIFLEAASKAYREPSKLKSEFAKWHLPCFMDIPLCETFLENPIILMKFLPSWLSERPLIPDPIESTHPSVLQAGEKALLRASVVEVRQNAEEQGILLCNAIEKAEREGMRVTGEVITPGGWVVDNMTLDLPVWRKLICEKVFADHVYILTDSEPDNMRIIRNWWEAYGKYACEIPSVRESETGEGSRTQPETSVTSSESLLENMDRNSLISLLAEWVLVNEQGDLQLDEIFEKLKPDIQNIRYFLPPFSVDAFCHNLFQNTVRNWVELKDDATTEDSLNYFQLITGLVSRSFLWSREVTASLTRIPLGTQLERNTKIVADFFNRKLTLKEKEMDISHNPTACAEFFKHLLTVPKKLNQLRELLSEAGRSETIEEVEITGKTPADVFTELRKKLMAPFIKKPRELEDFEVEEIKASTTGETYSAQGEFENDLSPGEDEDVRIFGESGELCIVSLERNKYALGKPEFSLRYYGKLYYFFSQDCKNKFIENPEKYAPYYSAIRCYPPLRVYVVGPLGSGKTTFANAIAEQCNLYLVNYSKFLWKKLVPHSNPSDIKHEIINEHPLLLGENHNEPAKTLQEKFKRVPFGKRQFWLEQSFHTTHEDNKEIYETLRRISITPYDLENFPELKYACVESFYETYGDDYQALMPKAPEDPEIPHVSMKELEKVINEYIESTSDLTDYCREKSLDTLWEQEPYITNGFILKGFPMRNHDAKYIIDQQWIPDLIVEMVLPEKVFVDRNLKISMSLWENKLKKETADQEALELALTTIQSNSRGIREKELTYEKLRQFETRPSQADDSTSSIGGKDPARSSRSRMKKRRITPEFYWNLEEGFQGKLPQEMMDEIEEILEEEFPPLVFKPIFETYNAGKERIIKSLINSYNRDMVELDKIRSLLADIDTTWVEFHTLENQENNLNELFLKIDKLNKPGIRKGEFAFTMKMEVAEKLLERGYFFLSKFGRLCPVQAYRMKNPVHMFRPLSARGKITPIAYRNYIYFVGGENEKVKFLEDPLKYTFHELHRPILPLRVAVIGPPKSGKTTLSKRLGAMFDLKVVTMGSALRFALEKTPQSTLAKSINGYLRRGCFLPLSLKLEALVICLNDPSCVAQGFVFDGIPFDAALTQSLAERGKLPYVIISLVANSHFAKVNREGLNLNEFRLPYKNRVNLDSRYKEWLDSYKRFAQWNRATYNNLYELNGTISVVDIFYQAFDIIKKSFFDVLNYFQHCVKDRALSLQNLCVGHQEYQSKKSSLGNNCPVCWAENNCLKKPPTSAAVSGLIQFSDHIYWICPEHAEKFLKDPKSYLPPAVPKWPEIFPERFTKNLEGKEFLSLKLHGLGRCPVTRVDFPTSLEWEGSYDFAVSYDHKLYLCKNEKMLRRFLARPWRYCKADTVFEVKRAQKSTAVLNLGPPKISSLPPIGFLEQTVANLLEEALRILGCVRPVYPNLHPRVTGCIFLALYFKVHNRKKPPCFLDRESLEYFTERCRARNYKLILTRPPAQGTGQGDYELALSEESDSSTAGRTSDPSEHNWLDFENQASRRMWSAKHVDQHFTEMKLTEANDLEAIPELPPPVTIVRYQTNSLRPFPLPPVENCLNFIYSVPPRLQVRDKFDYRCLYQSPSAFSLPFTPQILFNPQKQFSQALFHGREPSYASSINLHDEKRVWSDSSIREKPKLDINTQLITKSFFPRFTTLDKFIPSNFPATVQVLEKEPLAFNPHHEYSYMLLLSEFFQNTHFLRCFQMKERRLRLEYWDRKIENLDLRTPQVEFFFKPRTARSMKSRTSIDSYQEIFDSVTPFLIRKPEVKSWESANLEEKAESQKEDEPDEVKDFEPPNSYTTPRASMESSCPPPGGSAETLEINVDATNSDASQEVHVTIQEVLPFPPLTWEIASRPYYSFTMLSALFEKPHLEDIAHERHVSLLDGVSESQHHNRYVPYPTIQQEHSGQERSQQTKKLRNNVHSFSGFFYYDFFNIPWSSFLTCPYKWASNSIEDPEES